jgi:hypothetical protein
MSQDSSSTPSTSRFTLKLKPSSRKAPREAFSGAPGHSGSSPRPASASQTRGSDSPHKISGGTLSPSLPRPAANSARPQGKLSQKPGAAWSDELKHRMQKDMDALLTR